jgi:hypothetical protein
MQFKITTQQKDWVSFNQHIIESLPKTHKTWLDTQYLMIPLWAVFALVLMVIFDLNKGFDIKTALAVSLYLVILGLSLILNLKLKKKVFYPSPDGVFVGEHQFTIDEFGINSSGNGYHAHHGWKLVKKIERISIRKTKLIILYLDTCLGFIFPEDQLENPDDFYQKINALNQKSK